MRQCTQTATGIASHTVDQSRTSMRFPPDNYCQRLFLQSSTWLSVAKSKLVVLLFMG